MIALYTTGMVWIGLLEVNDEQDNQMEKGT